MRIIFVRHAVAIDRADWPGQDIERPLDAKGRWQAHRLAERFDELFTADSPILLTSRARRCADTLTPYGDHIGAPIDDHDLLQPARDHRHAPPMDDLAEVMGWLADRGVAFVDEITRSVLTTVVACTHGELILPTLGRIFTRDGVRMDDYPNDKGSFWTLDFDGTRCVAARHEPAP